MTSLSKSAINPAIAFFGRLPWQKAGIWRIG